MTSHKENLERLLTAEGVEELRSLTSDQLIEKLIYAQKWGPQSLGQTETDHVLSLIRFFMSKVEADTTFIQMRRLTVIAVGLSVIQAIVGIWSFFKHC